MAKSFEDDVKALFGAVTRRHLIRITSVWDDVEFDNAMVTASAKGFRMRVIRARGDTRIELSPVQEDSWKDLQHIRWQMLGLRDAEYVPVNDLVSFFDQHYDRLAEEYGRLTGSTSGPLKLLGKALWRRLFP